MHENTATTPKPKEATPKNTQPGPAATPNPAPPVDADKDGVWDMAYKVKLGKVTPQQGNDAILRKIREEAEESIGEARQIIRDAQQSIKEDQNTIDGIDQIRATLKTK